MLQLTRIKQRFAGNQKIRLRIGEEELFLANGERTTISLSRGEHPVEIRSGFGSVSGTVIIPAHKEIELGFRVSDRQLTFRMLAIAVVLAGALTLIFAYDQKWAVLLILAATIPSIISNRKALYVDVIGDEITPEILEELGIDPDEAPDAAN